MKKEAKRAITLIIAIIIVVVIIKLIQGFDTTHKDLVKLGYTDNDATKMMELLNEEQITSILESEYFEIIPKIITAKYYIPKNYNEYLEVAKNNEITDENSLIASVNTKTYKNAKVTDKEADYNNINMLVNKYNYLPENYEVTDLINISTMYAYEGHKTKQEVNNEYIRMAKDAQEQGLILIVNSSFRTFKEQQEQYDISTNGFAAKPGYSEHQTGLALDIVTHNTIGNQFEESDEFKWLKENAHKYGFILRYPKGKEEITGYAYESWHYRYLGTDLATKVYNSNITYEEYYAYYCEYKNEC